MPSSKGTVRDADYDIIIIISSRGYRPLWTVLTAEGRKVAIDEGEGLAGPRAQLEASTELRLALPGTPQDWHAEFSVSTIPLRPQFPKRHLTSECQLSMQVSSLYYTAWKENTTTSTLSLQK